MRPPGAHPKPGRVRMQGTCLTPQALSAAGRASCERVAATTTPATSSGVPDAAG